MGITRSPELLVLTAAALWGTSGLAVQLADMPAPVIALFRMAVPTVVIGSVFLIRRRPLPRAGLSLRLGASALNAVRMFFFFTAYQYTSIANAVVALYTWPIFAAIFARILLKERISRTRAVLLAVAFTGIPLLYLRALTNSATATADPFLRNDIIGISSMLLSAALHAMAIVLLKRATAGGSRLDSTFFQNVVGAVVFIPIVIVMRPELSLFQVSIGLYLGLIVGTIGFTLFFIGLHQASTAGTTNLAYFEVIVAVALSVVVLRQPVYWNTVVGGILIVVSVLLSRRIRET
ncbi:MAG: DMT family transporter [Spirochaeta sp.]|jgi:drug/metabolite transporter (DMT)-like permease|nr:DMT family transporter [Spirochaeta sp.]